MRTENKRLPDGSLRETGTPFLPFDPSPDAGAASCRVMPWPYAFPALPIACTFLRELNSDSSVQ